ncbi:MAG: PilZ domain-containing protein [Candidatus Eisenbacteria bacterium]|nr:PilZ domain-containing protein [Candidatus Eisenbacteria bacterium]
MSRPEDRRKHIRHDARFALKIGSEAVSHDQGIATEGLNISMGGIYCLVPRYIPLMTKLQATLVLPMPAPQKSGVREEKLFETEMIVVWSDPEAEIPGRESYRIGCAFLPLPPEKKGLLKEYLDSLE